MKTETDQITPEGIMQLGLAFWGSKTLLSAIELGLFTELAQSPLDATELTERLKLHQRGARDFLDALVSLGMLQREGGRYSNTPATDLFLDRHKPSYVAVCSRWQMAVKESGRNRIAVERPNQFRFPW
ncbi:MAG TPA: methyltransferase dimerization domain-containing protein [Pyrinomonadaceae bacterium]|nr:methyltransferase dimerization domain-containing protein [Pyrinomonadaceae bacterium]